MKFTIDVDCTPEEVRRVVGLPDLSEVHAAYLSKMKESMAKGMTPEVVESMVRTWLPGSSAGLDMMKDFITGISSASQSKKG
jgi:Family of unknown function (DUF6489)